jgi:hypothetical protein
MHYEMDYSGFGGDEKREAAVQDIKDYIGDRYDTWLAAIQHFVKEQGVPSFDKFAIVLSFSGIGGYPVRALYETLFKPEDWHD